MEELGAGRIPSAGELKTSNRREAGQAIRFLRAEVPWRWWCSARSGGVGVGRTAGGASGCVLLMCYLAGQLSKLVAAPRNGALAALLQAARAFTQTPTNGRKRLIHRYPNWFERGCLGGAVAKYTRERDGSIKVVNRCRRKDGSWKTITGRGNGRSGQRKRATEGALFRPLRRRLLDCWVGREELFLVSRWPSQPALSLDLIASAENYARPLQRDCGQRRQAGLFGGMDRAFARFHPPLKKRFGPSIFPLA